MPYNINYHYIFHYQIPISCFTYNNTKNQKILSIITNNILPYIIKVLTATNLLANISILARDIQNKIQITNLAPPLKQNRNSPQNHRQMIPHNLHHISSKLNIHNHIIRKNRLIKSKSTLISQILITITLKLLSLSYILKSLIVKQTINKLISLQHHKL